MNERPYRLVKIPIIEPLDYLNVWEHTPVDFFKYGQYPRFIRPIRPPYIKYEIMKEEIKEKQND